MSQLSVKRGVSYAKEATAVATELAANVANPDAAVVLLFASPSLDAHGVAAAVSDAVAPTPVYGCTTAGEIGEDGFHSGSAVAMSLAADDLQVGVGLATGIAGSGLSGGRRATLAAIQALGTSASELNPDRHVAISLIDGRSGQEEMFIAGAAASAPSIAFVGGSASDDLAAAPAARVFHDGLAHADSGLIMMFQTDIPFATVISEHMVSTDDRVVVTASDPGSRLVHELNGRPAREVYEEIVGASDIDTALASQHPFGYYVGGQAFVRSVMSVEGDSLRFACAVDHGAVLRPMRPGDMVRTTQDALSAACEAVGGELGALITFNCLGRFLEARDRGMREEIAESLTRYPVVGFNTFGEQFNALHVNHTLTALAFGTGLSNG